MYTVYCILYTVYCVVCPLSGTDEMKRDETKLQKHMWYGGSRDGDLPPHVIGMMDCCRCLPTLLRVVTRTWVVQWSGFVVLWLPNVAEVKVCSDVVVGFFFLNYNDQLRGETMRTVLVNTVGSPGRGRGLMA